MTATDRAHVERIVRAVEGRADDIVAVVDFLHAHPELAHQEHRGAGHLVAALAPYARIEQGFAGLPTAFRAVIDSERPGPTVGIVSVYDAVAALDANGRIVPEHSCGHGPIAAATVGAAAALHELADSGEIAGRVVIVGAPADEIVSPSAIARGGGGKTLGWDVGLWDGIDAVLYVHPESHTGVWRSSRWLRIVRAEGPFGLPFEQWDLPAGEAAAPTTETDGEGRQLAVVRILGGDAAEIEERERAVRERIRPTGWSVLTTAEGLAADAHVARMAETALRDLGIEVDESIPPMPFSTDFGTVSRRIPGVMVGLAHADGWAIHEPRGEAQFHSPRGAELARTAAAVLAVATDALLRDGFEGGRSA